MAKAWLWLRTDGLPWMLRLSFLAVGVDIILSKIGISSAKPDPGTLLGLNVAVLWLFMEFLLHDHKNTDAGTHIAAWPDVVAIANEAMARGTEVDIVCSSSNTFYLAFQEAISRRSNMRIRVLMRYDRDAAPERISKLMEYKGYWEALNDPNANRSVEVGFVEQSLLRMLRVDKLVAIGYYEWNEREQRLFGHTTKLHLVRQNDVENEYFLGMFSALFGRLWRNSYAEV
jgi:hypothetical protein